MDQSISAILVDLVSDSSENTSDQLTQFVKARQQVQRSWPERVIHLTPDLDDANSSTGKEEGLIGEITGEVNREVNREVNEEVYEEVYESVNEHGGPPGGSLVRFLFEAKRRLDDDGVTDLVLVTSLVMKKVAERLCYHLFTHVHTWAVIGVDVSGQDLALAVPTEAEVDLHVRNFLRGLGKPDQVRILRSDIFPEHLFNAGFSTRPGGVSSLGPLASLNLHHTVRKPDPMAVIDENKRRLAQAAGFDLDLLNIARVEHGTKIWVVEKSGERPVKYDGVVTNTPGVTVAAPGADCCMILLGDQKTGACGAVHSGWAGTIKGAVRSLLATMADEYGTKPCNVVAAIGPSIEARCFHLPLENAQPLADLDPTLTWPHETSRDHCHVDLVRANAVMLEREGVPPTSIDVTQAKCTACHKALFFSHRRDGIPFGNQIGFIKCLGPASSKPE